MILRKAAEELEDLDTLANTNMKYFLFNIILLLLVLNPVVVFTQDDDVFTYEYALLEAARQKTIGNVNEAIRLYKKCIEAKPVSAVAYYELGSIYAVMNQPEISNEFLSKAHNLEPNNYWYLLAYIQILDYRNEYEKIIDILKDYLQDNIDLRMSYTLANAYASSGKDRKALKILDKMEKENGVSEQIILKKVGILKEMDKFDKAEGELLKLIDVLPESPEYHILMAEFYQEAGNEEKAVEYFNIAYDLDSTNIYAISNLADYYTKKGPVERGLFYINRAFTLDDIPLEKKLSTMLYYMGEEKMLKEYSDDYEVIINTLLEKYPDNYDIKTIAYDFYNKTERYEKAYNLIKELVEEKKDNFILWQQAIYTASLLNKYDDIIDLGNRALKIFPNKKELLLFMGIAYFQKEEYKNCYDYLMKGYEPGLQLQMQIQYLTFLAESSYRIEKTSESFYFFEELLLLKPDDYMIMNNYSYYMALEDTDLNRAEELSRKTILKFPDNSTYIDTYAWILFKMERYDESRTYMEKIKDIKDQSGEVVYHYAWILCKTGDKMEAIRYFEMARGKDYEDMEEIKNGIESCR